MNCVLTLLFLGQNLFVREICGGDVANWHHPWSRFPFSVMSLEQIVTQMGCDLLWAGQSGVLAANEPDGRRKPWWPCRGPAGTAFAMLPPGTVDALVKPENKATLTNVLTYHVVAGSYD
jgi:hypothetical protein